MRLGALIRALEAMPRDAVVPFGFSRPNSYRGYYDQVAFAPAENVTVGSMLAHARSAIGPTFTGWKGGDYTYDEWTDCWIAEPGDATGDGMGPTLLRYMLRAAIVPGLPA